jgi:hypothetical protein
MWKAKRDCAYWPSYRSILYLSFVKDYIALSVADLTPGTKLSEDFDEESGSIDIGPVMKILKLILSQDLKNCRDSLSE